MELGIVWPPTWLELAWIWSSSDFRPNSSQVFHRLATSSQLSPSCFLIVMWLRGRIQTIEWFTCDLARLGGLVWPPAYASFDFITWLKLAWVGSTVWRTSVSSPDSSPVPFSFPSLWRRTNGEWSIWNFPCSLTRTSHSVKNLGVHSLLRRKMIILPILTTSLAHLDNSWDNLLLNLGAKGLTLSLPRVINYKFLLQPHQQYYITQYGEPGSSHLTQVENDSATKFSLPHLYIYL